MSEAVIPGGYVMIARQVRKSSLWLSLKCTHRMVMMEILLQAQWQDGDVIRNGEIIPLKRGQVATSYQQLVDDIADKDVTIKIVRTAIDKMERAQFLAKDEAVQKAKKGLLLTVVKYGYFQDSDNYKGRVEGNEEDKARAESGQSEGRARAINNKDNNSNKGNKVNNLKEYTPEFDEFWNVYPRKISKSVAFTKWKKVIKTESFDYLMQCANNYDKEVQMKQTEDQYIKHPATFLEKERYKDYYLLVIGGGNNAKPQDRTQGVRHGSYSSKGREPEISDSEMDELFAASEVRMQQMQ